MARRVPREMTVEEFDDWSNATKKFEDVVEAADEVGGPRLSLVPLPEQNIAWPTDLLPPSAEVCSPAKGPHQSTTLVGPKAGVQSEQESVWAPASAGELAPEPPVPAMPFDGIPLESSRKRLAGWSSRRRR